MCNKLNALIVVRKLSRRIFQYINNFFKFLIIAVLTPFILSLFFVLYLFEPFYKVRFYHLGALDHFGWQILFPDRVLRSWQLNPLSSDTCPIILAHSPENKTHFQMLKRMAIVWDGKWVNRFADISRVILSHTRFFVYDHEKPHDPILYPDIHDKEAKIKPPLSFTAEEMERGYTELERMGVGRTDWFVCFHNRDSAHYNWNDHQNIRNSTIEKFLSAAQYITDRGGFAIRVGASVAHPLPETGNSKIIDYATHYRSDFMDVFLLAHTKFFLASLSGIYMCASAFDRPVVLTNHIDLSNRPPQPYSTFIPKHLRDKDTNRLLTFKETIDLGFEMPTAEKLMWLTKSKYEYIENSEDEILEACKDMFELMDKIKQPEEASDLQIYFDKNLVSVKFQDLIKGAAPISPSFLLRHKGLIFK